jgi:polycomb protein EED
VWQAFHHTGRYLLSGGLDCIINLWALPELPDENSGTDKVTLLHYPHFSTSAVHSNFVDWCAVLPGLICAAIQIAGETDIHSVAFHDDLILSKCAMECKIVLWRIEGFSSSDPVPSSDAAPSTHKFRETRSAFGGDICVYSSSRVRIRLRSTCDLVCSPSRSKPLSLLLATRRAKFSFGIF